VRASRAPALAFCDADCRPEPEWLEAGLAALEVADVVAGLVRFEAPRDRTVWSLLDVDLHLDQERAIRAGRAATANLFVRREAFELVGGFDESLPNTSDSDFVRRCMEAGGRLGFEPRAVVRHPTRDRPRELLTKLWRVQRALGVRDARAGQRPKLATVASIPILGPLRSRRRAGRPLRLDRERLAANGLAPPTPWEELQATALLYAVVPVVARAARFAGWRRSLRA
jgi:GT2 family glycosyltransferase